MKPNRNSHPRGKKGTLRITGGIWRSRRISFPVLPGLRPSTDVARERLFSWLSSRVKLDKFRVLDAFCGSGILGIEALSRGALSCDFLDYSPKAIRFLSQSLDVLEVLKSKIVLHCATFESFSLKKEASSYDLICLDPPFSDSLKDESLLAWVSRDEHFSGWVYMECDPSFGAFKIPECLDTIHDQTRSGVRVLFLKAKERISKA